MSEVILYKNDEGNLAVVYPMPEVVKLYGILEVARKDVPHGKPFAILDSSHLPSDYSTRSAWVVDDVDLKDGVGSESYEFQSTKA